ncbi:MAG: preprotein translocase subunit YajC, partial [Candidatus Omnitrophica bacterium]|nr:preprotein translocase subunit YajC [Candidatus Omnitrophota bacterium]
MEQGGNVFYQLVPLIFLFAIFYFLLIRPQKKQQKQHQEMIANLKKNDQVVT